MMMMMMQTAPTSSSDDGVPVAVTKKVAEDHSMECGQEPTNLAAITSADNVHSGGGCVGVPFDPIPDELGSRYSGGAPQRHVAADADVSLTGAGVEERGERKTDINGIAAADGARQPTAVHRRRRASNEAETIRQRAEIGEGPAENGCGPKDEDATTRRAPGDECTPDRIAAPCAPAKSRYMNSRAKPNHAYEPTDVEHLANVITHGLWIAPSIVGLWWMTSLSTSPLQHISAVVYGLSLFCLFTVSTTFHTLAYCRRFRELQKFFHIGDRAVIYIFIASSYTPWLTLKDFHRWSLLTLFIVWVAAVLGIAYQYTYHERYKWFETLLYMVVGMAPSIIILEMKESSGLAELAAGGALYVIGVIFFKCDGVIPFAHAIWHSFVFVGAAFHFVAVCRHLLVAPPSSAASGGILSDLADIDLLSHYGHSQEHSSLANGVR